MMLSIESLKQSGSFVGKPVKKEITWHVDGKEFKSEVFVRRASYLTVTQEWRAQAEEKDALANRIAGFICDESGAPVFTIEDVLGQTEDSRGELCAALAIVLLAAIHEVNKPPAEEKKSPTTSGSSSSSQVSAAKQSRKPSKT